MKLESSERPLPLSLAYRKLAAAQKSSVGVSAYSRWVNRPFGRLLAVVAYRLGLGPNQVTAVSALVTLAGIAVLAVGSPSASTALIVTALLVLGYALDSADGQVARLAGGGTPAGEWLDHVVDSVKNLLVHVAVLIHWFRMESLPSTSWLLVPLAFGVIATCWFFAITLTELMGRIHQMPDSNSHVRRRPPIQAVAVLPADYGVLCMSFLAIVAPGLWIGLYTALMAATGLLLARQLAVWYRRVSDLSRSTDRRGV